MVNFITQKIGKEKMGKISFFSHLCGFVIVLPTTLKTKTKQTLSSWVQALAGNSWVARYLLPKQLFIG